MSKGKVKSIESTTRRIIAKVEAGDYDHEQIEHMIQSLIKNRDKVIKNLKNMSRPRELVLNEKAISGALRDTIKHHGNITKFTIGSASKRILGQCLRIVDDSKDKWKVADVFVLHDAGMRGTMPKALTEEVGHAILTSDAYKHNGVS